MALRCYFILYGLLLILFVQTRLVELAKEAICIRYTVTFSNNSEFSDIVQNYSEFSDIADFDLIGRTSTVGKLAYVPQVLAKWRVHAGSGTWSSKMAFVFEKKNEQIKERCLFSYNN